MQTDQYKQQKTNKQMLAEPIKRFIKESHHYFIDSDASALSLLFLEFNTRKRLVMSGNFHVL